MKLFSETLLRPADITNPHGEEIWLNIGRNTVLVRLRPGTRSETHYHKIITERCSVLNGQLSLLLNGVESIYEFGPIITIPPLAWHQVFNHSKFDATFLVRSSAEWKTEDQYFV